MKQLSVAGGVYSETVQWPEWREIYGSGGRAAAAVANNQLRVNLHTYGTRKSLELFQLYANGYGFLLFGTKSEQDIKFEYVDCLAEPNIRPALHQIYKNEAIHLAAENVLRFGMLEGTAVVECKNCVYDPQSPLAPEHFDENGSKCERLAIVGNIKEIQLLGEHTNVVAASQVLLGRGATVVIVKGGPDGSKVITSDGVKSVPAYATDSVWTLGSGDVFSAAFAVEWAVNERPACCAADCASRAVAVFASNRILPYQEPLFELSAASAKTKSVYLASPFFTMGQLWLVDRTRRAFREMGVEVFSPYHEVGMGVPSVVAKKDLDALKECDAVFAIADGLDAGTIFEIGYANAIGKPVYVFAQTLSDRDLCMMEGARCRVFDDFVTAVYNTVWGT